MKFLINLDERKDRLEESKVEIAKLGFTDVIRFPAIKTENGLFGCLLSHLYCLNFAYQQQKSAMIFEDDFKLINEYNEILPKALNELEQKDWSLFYLGGNIYQGEVIQETDHLGRLTFCQSTHSICVNYKYIPQIIFTILGIYGMPLDLIYCNYIIPNLPCYITVPKMIAIQRDSYSDIEMQNVNYSSWMEKRYYAKLKLFDKNP